METLRVYVCPLEFGYAVSVYLDDQHVARWCGCDEAMLDEVKAAILQIVRRHIHVTS